MALADLLNTTGVLGVLTASNRKQALQLLSEAAAEQTGLDRAQVLDAVMERERLGSTGVGEGVAIPHARLDGIDRVFGVFVRLKTPVDFDSIDGRPADLIFLLLAPKESSAEHLKALARVSRVMRRDDIRARLRSTHDKDGIAAVLTTELEPDAA